MIKKLLSKLARKYLAKEFKELSETEMAKEIPFDSFTMNKLSNAYDINCSLGCLKNPKDYSNDDIETITAVANDCWMHDENGYSFNHILDKIVNALNDKTYSVDEISDMSHWDILSEIVC